MLASRQVQCLIPGFPIEGADVHAVRGAHPNVRYRKNSALRWTTGTGHEPATRSTVVNGGFGLGQLTFERVAKF
jgi:hypothetical protein